MICAVLFDLDGLMVDSEPHSLRSWHAILASRGVTLDQPTTERMLGLRQVETGQMLVDRYRLPDQPSALSREKEEYQIRHLNGNVRAMPGLRELLDEIDRRALRKAIASSGVRRYVNAVLEIIDLTGRFSTIITGDDVHNGKPAPDVFLAAAHALQTDPQHCLVLEDAPAGVQAAKAAGMQCVAIPNYHTGGLDLSLADYLFPSLIEVRDALPRLIAG